MKSKRTAEIAPSVVTFSLLSILSIQISPVFEPEKTMP